MINNRLEFTIDKDKIRLDMSFQNYFEEHSRSYWQKLIGGGSVSVNGQVETAKNKKLKVGDIVVCEIPEDKEIEIVPENIPLNIVYEDDDVLVVDKPKEMVVHPAVGNYTGTLVNAIMYHCKDRLSSINGEIRPGIVHRIDKNTSGLLMIAKNDKAHNALAEQLKEHSSTRKYLAIVYNNFNQDKGVVDAPIGRDPRNRLKQAINYQNGKEAITHYTVKERFGKFTLVECVLETGRTHQIRVHMAHINHPLLGDDVYGPEKNKVGAKGQMLHAYILGFKHPTTGEYMEFESPLPEEFEKVIEKLRKESK